MSSKNVLGADNQQVRKKVSNEYLAGFVDGEGCFYVGFGKRNDLPLGWQVITEFHVSQNPGGINVLEVLKERLDCGYIKPNHAKNPKDNSWVLVVKNREDLVKSLVAFYLVSLVDKLFSEAEVDNRFFVFLRVFLEYLDSSEVLDDQMAIFIIDVFVVNLLSFLGFKLSSDEKIINSEFLPYIQIFEKGDLSEIFSLNFDLNLAKKIHKLVYDSLLSYTERKVADWAKTCII